MIDFAQLIVRHGLAALAAYLSAKGFGGVDTTAGILCALVILGVVCFWSWVAKMMKFDPAFGIGPGTGDALRTMLGTLVSQGITFASTYYAIDANDPSALAVAVLNSIASHYGVHQQIAHQTPIAVASAIKVIAGALLMSCMVSCTGLTAFLASPVGQAAVASAATLGKQLANAVVETEVAQIITKATASLAALEAQGVNSDTAKEITRQGEMAALQAVIDAAQNQYLGMTGAKYVIPLTPVPAVPASTPAAPAMKTSTAS